jgi:hypothetical protein
MAEPQRFPFPSVCAFTEHVRTTPRVAEINGLINFMNEPGV